ncbi:hypothetical protein ACFSQ7_32550 [Paenibacillus rhizoplanae]
MVQELQALGIELMVSVWPTVQTESENYKEMLEKKGICCARTAGCGHNSSSLDRMRSSMRRIRRPVSSCGD